MVPRLGSELAYFVALHEIGHIVLRLRSSASDDEAGEPIRLYNNEATVWEWAIGESRISPSSDAEDKFIKFLMTDERGPGRTEAPARVRASCAARRAVDDSASGS